LLHELLDSMLLLELLLELCPGQHSSWCWQLLVLLLL
jgi:hypothetical protein